ncbi:MAG TPA: hypothetical protein VK422_12055, partial [Pyrinomonadaceae bacterium]|nr:hypothetical protein [Pyrinomonadaceae bacterium]
IGYVFHSAIYNLIGDFEKFPIILLVVVAVGILGFYLVERYWLSKKVEEADAESIQKFEQAAEEKLHEIKEEISDILPHPLARHKESAKQKQKIEGD